MKHNSPTHARANKHTYTRKGDGDENIEMKRINVRCARDKNMVGQDQLRYIGCQHKAMTQMYSDWKFLSNFSAQNGTMNN